MANTDVEEIKHRLNIVDLVGQYVTLKKAGINYKGLCPFHQERSGSFMVNPDRQIYKCFGCNEGGDAFDFVMKMEGLTFPEALQLLADRAGVVLTKQVNDKRSEGARDEKSRLYRVNLFAAKYFAQLFEKSPDAQAARDYLSKRTVTAESIRTFQVGFAPTVNKLPTLLQQKGVSANELNKSGNPDRFRNRIMFPLTDPMGNVVGFTGRGLTNDQVPKYLNTPETALFKKARTLYGLTQAKQAMRKAGYAILVEGQMDVLLSHQAGVLEAIASSGTALTDEHLRMIRRYVPTIRFAFDADEAGFKAAERAIFAAIDAGLTVELITLPAGIKDVGELVEQRPAEWPVVAKQSKPIVDWVMDQLTVRRGNPSSAAEKKAFAKEVLPYLARLADPIEQAHYVSDLARRLRTQEAVIRESLGRMKPAATPTAAPNPTVPTKKDDKPLTLVEQLVVLLIIHPAELKRTMGLLDSHDFESEADQNLFKALQSCYTTGSQQPTFDMKGLLVCMNEKLDPITHDRLLTNVLRSESHYTDGAVDAAQEIGELTERLKGSKREQLKRNFAADIADAEAKGDRKKVKALMLEFQTLLSKELKNTDS